MHRNDIQIPVLIQIRHYQSVGAAQLVAASGVIVDQVFLPGDVTSIRSGLAVVGVSARFPPGSTTAAVSSGSLEEQPLRLSNAIPSKMAKYFMADVPSLNAAPPGSRRIRLSLSQFAPGLDEAACQAPASLSKFTEFTVFCNLAGQNINDLACDLLNAREERTAIAALPSSGGAFTLDDAYAVEAEIMRLRQAAGHAPRGRKVGFANKAMWRILKMETLVWARMYDDSVHMASCNAAELPASGFHQARLEPEIVFKLKSAPAADLDAAGALACVDWIAIGFEIIDCPFPDWEIQPVDFVAAYGLHRALVIGEPKPVDSIPGLIDLLPKFKLTLKNAAGEEEEAGAGKNSLRSPAACLAELATATCSRNQPLEAGELISTGTLSKAPDIVAGQDWTITLDGLDLPSLRLKIT